MTDQENATALSNVADRLNEHIRAASASGLTVGLLVAPRHGSRPPQVKVKVFRELVGEIDGNDL